MSSAPSIAHADFFNWPETKSLMRALGDARIETRFVGGVVRDALLNVTSSDVDLCTPSHPEALFNALESHGVRAIPTGIEHGTITAVIQKKHFEITTLRRDVACDGRHAEVVYTDSYAEDAARRDFTVNALSADGRGHVYDYHQGIEDLNAKYLRFIGNAEDRITEDALRILRLFRFQAQLEFTVDAAALDACAMLKDKLAIISAERIKNELFKLLAANNPQNAINSMVQSGVWQQCFGSQLGSSIAPILAAEKALNQPRDPLVRFGFLVSQTQPQNIKTTSVALQKLLHLSNDETSHIKKWLTALSDIQTEMPLATERALQRQFGTDCHTAALLIASARDGEAHYSAYQQKLENAAKWQIPTFPLSGNDLIALGYTSGTTLGKALKALEQQWEASGYSLNKEQLLEHAKAKLK